MADGDAARTRQIKIKTGVVKRLSKEKTAYEKEVVQQDSRVEKMKADSADEYDIRKQVEVLNESKAMIPDCEKRLQKAYAELTAMLETEKDLNQTEEYKVAVSMIEEIAPMIK